MYVKNVSILKSTVLRCKKILGDYLISRSIPVLNRDLNVYSFVYTDIVEEIVKNLPNNLKKEGYNLE